MWRAHLGRHPQAQQEPTQWRGKIPARHASHPARITIKGHLTRTAVLAQKGDHRFHGRLCVEILAGLGQQSDRGSGVTESADFDDRLALADAGLCSGETEPTSFCIQLDLFHWRAQFAWVGRLFATRQQTARGVQDLPDRSTGAGQRDVCCLQLRVTGKRVEQGTRPRHTRSAFSGGAKRISTIRWMTRTSQRKEGA